MSVLKLTELLMMTRTCQLHTYNYNTYTTLPYLHNYTFNTDACDLNDSIVVFLYNNYISIIFITILIINIILINSLFY